MKLHFEADLDYQRDEINAVCDIFHCQEVCRTEFTVSLAGANDQLPLGVARSDLGIGNSLTISDDAILANLRAVQLRNGLAPSESLDSGDFTVEMETGTGKTYVYLRTIFELNRRFGFTKFVIVVPSIAIKEGVYKTLQMTEEHFRSIYAGARSEYFIYDSTELGQVRNFATSVGMQIMVVTVGAINKKDVNNLYKGRDQTYDERPVDLISATHPIVIVDEPQSVDGGIKGAGKSALAAMDPLCTLRYSATHVDQHHMVYRLDAVDAYERKLVKQIEVASATVEDAHNAPFVQLVSVDSRRKTISATVLVDMQRQARVERTEVTVHDGDDLEDVTGRAVYRNCRIGELRAGRGNHLLELRTPDGEHYLAPGAAWGDVDALTVQRQMIRRTIRDHLNKQERLRSRGIKVLSLFFVDAVDRYRRYDEAGNAVRGPYAEIFEDEYRLLAAHPAHRAAAGDATAASVHDGYFSIDRKNKGRFVDTEERTQSGRDKAEQAYNLIMRDKEKLLSFESPLGFIFSHSALREGWDNPNVFQICSLRDIRSERERRQTIGRGLRLCVDQSGNRVRGFEVNTLTVVATEGYEQFAAGLQLEIEAATGIRFGHVEPHQFAAVAVATADGGTAPMGFELSKAVWEHLHAHGYISTEGRILQPLRAALRDGTLSVPPFATAEVGQIAALLRKLAGRIEVLDADNPHRVKPRPAVLLSAEFKALWDRIKYKTTYRVDFNSERLIEDCARALHDAPKIPRARLEWRTAGIAIGRSGVKAVQRTASMPTTLPQVTAELPDILTALQDRTRLTRRTIQRILSASERLNDFRRNPQYFIDLAATTINSRKRVAIVNGIRYERRGGEHYYAQELLDQEMVGSLHRMIADPGRKSVYDYVIYDSEVEALFARQLEMNSGVKLFTKLPAWFVVPTPLGNYNPDWAVLIEDEQSERLYLVIETKGSLIAEDLRAAEQGKIVCGRAHFNALRVMESPARYVVAASLDDVYNDAVAK